MVTDPPIDSTLIEKLEAEKRYSANPIFARLDKEYNEAIDAAIAIVRQHQAEAKPAASQEVNWRGYVAEALRMLKEPYQDYGHAIDLLETIMGGVEANDGESRPHSSATGPKGDNLAPPHPATAETVIDDQSEAELRATAHYEDNLRLRKRIAKAIGGLRSIAYGDAQTWPNCSAREVAKQALKDCGGEKLMGDGPIREDGRTAGATERGDHGQPFSTSPANSSEISVSNERDAALVHSAIGCLEPIADRDWDGKWRIKKALAFLSQVGDTTPKPVSVEAAAEVIKAHPSRPAVTPTFTILQNAAPKHGG